MKSTIIGAECPRPGDDFTWKSRFKLDDQTCHSRIILLYKFNENCQSKNRVHAQTMFRDIAHRSSHRVLHPVLQSAAATATTAAMSNCHILCISDGQTTKKMGQTGERNGRRRKTAAGNMFAVDLIRFSRLPVAAAIIATRGRTEQTRARSSIPLARFFVVVVFFFVLISRGHLYMQDMRFSMIQSSTSPV